MTLPRLCIALIALSMKLALAATPATPADPADLGPPPDIPSLTSDPLLAEQCLSTEAATERPPDPLDAETSPVAPIEACRRFWLIPRGHALPDLSRLRPVADALPLTATPRAARPEHI